MSAQGAVPGHINERGLFLISNPSTKPGPFLAHVHIPRKQTRFPPGFWFPPRQSESVLHDQPHVPSIHSTPGPKFKQSTGCTHSGTKGNAPKLASQIVGLGEGEGEGDGDGEGGGNGEGDGICFENDKLMGEDMDCMMWKWRREMISKQCISIQHTRKVEPHKRRGICSTIKF